MCMIMIDTDHIDVYYMYMIMIDNDHYIYIYDKASMLIGTII